MFRLFLITCLTVGLASADFTKEEADHHAYNCVLGLTSEGMDVEDEFSALHPDVKYDKEFCNGIVEKMQEQIYDGLIESYKAVFDSYGMQYDSCVVDKLKEAEVGILYLTQFLYQNETNATQLQRKEWESELLYKIQSKREFAWGSCHPLKAFGKDFDDAYKNNFVEYTIYKKVGYELSPLELEESYCIKHSLLESNFSGISSYSIDVNPKKIDVTKIDCDKMLAKESSVLIGGLTDAITSGVKFSDDKQDFCVRDVVQTSRYVDWIYLIWTLGEKGIDEGAKDHFKHDFAKFMEKLYKKASECYA